MPSGSFIRCMVNVLIEFSQKCNLRLCIRLSHVVRNLSSGFPTKSDTNKAEGAWWPGG